MAFSRWFVSILYVSQKGEEPNYSLDSFPGGFEPTYPSLLPDSRPDCTLIQAAANRHVPDIPWKSAVTAPSAQLRIK